MAVQNEAPYISHVFVCTNDRHGKRRSCADRNSPAIRDTLKEEVKKRGWYKQVRVSKTGCMGLCGNGPNAIIYPQNKWFSEVSSGDIKQIISEIDKFLGNSI